MQENVPHFSFIVVVLTPEVCGDKKVASAGNPQTEMITSGPRIIRIRNSRITTGDTCPNDYPAGS